MIIPESSEYNDVVEWLKDLKSIYYPRGGVSRIIERLREMKLNSEFQRSRVVKYGFELLKRQREEGLGSELIFNFGKYEDLERFYYYMVERDIYDQQQLHYFYSLLERDIIPSEDYYRKFVDRFDSIYPYKRYHFHPYVVFAAKIDYHKGVQYTAQRIFTRDIYDETFDTTMKRIRAYSKRVGLDADRFLSDCLSLIDDSGIIAKVKPYIENDIKNK